MKCQLIVLIILALYFDVLPVFAHPKSIKHPNQQTRLTVQQIATQALRSVVRLTVINRNGVAFRQASGVIIAKNLIITNFHVIKDAHAMTANFINGRSETVLGIVSVDPVNDLALIWALTTNAPALPLAPDGQTQLADTVIAVGNPEGLSGSISTGIISGFRTLNGAKVIQTTAPISPGSSGGALLDTKARVIGITSFTFTEGQNLNFAYPVYYAKLLIPRGNIRLVTWKQEEDFLVAKHKANNLGLTIAIDASTYSKVPDASDNAPPNSAQMVKEVFGNARIQMPDSEGDQATIGYDVPHNVAAGEWTQWVKGDRLYFAVSHPHIDDTGIYLGNSLFVHIDDHGETVITRVDDAFYSAHLVAVRRSKELLNEDPT